MYRPCPPYHQVRFGEFQLDLQTAELQNNGHRLMLQDQPFRVLTILLEQPGRLVTRTELKNRLWPSDTFVDFDHGLNKAVNRLREALGDSAGSPRFIETLPRKGYRFIGPVAPADAGAGAYSERTIRKPSWKFAASVLGWTLAIGLAGLVIWKTVWTVHSRALQAPIHSLAVLPLENLSGDATQDYFAGAITDALITGLGQISALRVISRTSSIQCKGAHKPLLQIARELNVDAVVTGTVFRSGDHVRVTAQLIEPRSDQHFWAETYQGDLRNVLALQTQVVSAIAGQIRIKLATQQLPALKNPRLISPEAYEAYLRAVSQKGTVDGLQQSIAYFQQALSKEPNYAEAHAGLANAYVQLGHMAAMPPQDAFPQAKTEALKALEADQSSGEAHSLLASVEFLYDWDFPAAEKEFQRAISLNPNSIAAHGGYSDFLNAMGRPDEAIAERVRIRQIDPLSLSAIFAIGWEEYWAGRYDPAIEKARTVLAVDPNHDRAHLTLGLCLEQKHQFPAAIEELQKAADLSNDKMWMVFVAHAKALAGDKAGALRILADLQVLSRQSYVSPWCFALIYAGLGDKERVLFWLERSYEGREHDLVFSQVWPFFDSIRSDPRYVDLLRRVGLPR
jgi:TolB-like protein/DNA-binding winged helix-turn-helix (wHTH) protein/Tfp pilus assembly protein PilF